MIRRTAPGEYHPLVWDGDGQPAAHYVTGHVDGPTFRAAVDAYFRVDGAQPRKGRPQIPDDAKFVHVYVRSVPSSSYDFDREWRHCGKGRGAKAMTVWDVPGLESRADGRS